MAAPIRTPELAPYDPPRPAAPNGRARRADGARQKHDGWTFVLIPPGTGARPRTLFISVRRLRAFVFAGCAAAGASVLVMAVLGLVLSAVPKLETEARGVELGVLAVGSPAAAVATPPPASPAPAPPFEIAAPATPTAAVPAAEPSVSVADAAPTPTPKAAAPNVVAPARARPAARFAPKPVREARVASVAEGSGDDAAESAESHSFISSMPVIGRITSNFSRARRHPLLGIVRRHKGVDIAAPAGTRITAPVAGRVVFAGRRVGFGNVVELVHSGGVMTRYAHCRRINVHEGDRVKAGQTIATVGSTGLATGPHLHYEVLVNGESVDPMRHPVTSFLAKDAASNGGVALPPPPAPSVVPSGSALAPASITPSGPQESPKDSTATPDR